MILCPCLAPSACFALVRSRSDNLESPARRIPSDYQCGAPAHVGERPRTARLPPAFVNPPQTKPFGFARLVSAIDFTKCIVAVKPILNIAADPLGALSALGRVAAFADDDQIVVSSMIAEAIDCKEFVCKTAYRHKHDLMLIRTAGHLLHRSHGQIRIADLAAQSYLSSSQFERQFKHYTAISPKAYARIVRFGSLQAALLVNPSIRLADLADVYGYSDPAHLIREFKSFADCTPRDFAASAPAYFELRQNEDWCDFMKQYFNVSYAG